MEEIITVNGQQYKIESTVPLTQVQRNETIKQLYEKNTISTLAPTCSASSKLVGNIVTVGSTPSGGTPLYTVAFQKNGVPFKTFPGVPEATNVSTTYTLISTDVGSQVFSVVITDSCATGAKTTTESCTVSVALPCNVPVANFTLT